MRNRKQTEDAGGVLCALSCMRIILPRDILQMHLHISLHDNLIGVASSSKSHQTKPSYLPKN